MPSGGAGGGFLDRFFKLTEHGTSVRTEIIAGLTVFLSMAYIIFVNPSILGDAGMPKQSVFVATCLIAAFGTTVMALYANYPIALAPGMGLNAYFAYVVVLAMGYTWQQALGAVLVSGILFLATTVFGLRQLIVRGIPQCLRVAITTGIGLFLALVALKSAGIVAPDKATYVTLGNLHQASVVLFTLGFILVVALDRLGFKGGIIISILVVTALSFFFAGNQFNGIFDLPPSIEPTFMKLDLTGALSHGIGSVILVFFLVELFDATGTMLGVAKRAGLLEEKAGGMKRLNKALLADSSAIFVGAFLGTSSTTAYIESAAGVQAGGRTGLSALTVAVMFLAALFIAPLAGSVPAYATAPALFFVGCLMMREISEINWDETTDVIPAVVTALAMPYTYSIANGLAFGFITYAVLKGLTGRAKEVHWMIWIIAAVFLFKFAFIGGH